MLGCAVNATFSSSDDARASTQNKGDPRCGGVLSLAKQ